ncbi:MAG TPA: Uma2 family endonuclease [Pyrinomonadaceae bacterium]|nr:Uma2 family endonuclease [Pyrinomonadaceae bacterium]
MTKLLDEPKPAEHHPQTGAAIMLDLRPVVDLTDDQFYELCRANHELRFERTAEGEILIMPPTGSRTGQRNFTLTTLFGIWVRQDGTGIGFDSSTAFKLPNGATRSPDASWIKRERWHAPAPGEKEKFSPICPDFVIELRSSTDSLPELQAKMREYIFNGARLGWLLDPQEQTAYVYRPGAEVETIEGAQGISGEPELMGFTLNLQEIW